MAPLYNALFPMIQCIAEGGLFVLCCIWWNWEKAHHTHIYILCTTCQHIRRFLRESQSIFTVVVNNKEMVNILCVYSEYTLCVLWVYTETSHTHTYITYTSKGPGGPFVEQVGPYLCVGFSIPLIYSILKFFRGNFSLRSRTGDSLFQ